MKFLHLLFMLKHHLSQPALRILHVVPDLIQVFLQTVVNGHDYQEDEEHYCHRPQTAGEASITGIVPGHVAFPCNQRSS